MSALTAVSPSLLADWVGTHRFSEADFRRMLDEGIVQPDEPIEFLDGYVALNRSVSVVPREYFPRYVRLRRWTGADCEWMARVGIVGSEDRCELLDGYLVNKMVQDTPHASTGERFTEDLMRLVPAGWRVRIQLPLDLGDSVTEPDACVVRGGRRTFSERHPTAGDVGLVIEVSESTLSIDRGFKKRLYAAAGIPVYWIVNLIDGVVEVCSDPTSTGYATRTDYRVGDMVPVVLDGIEIARLPASEVLP